MDDATRKLLKNALSRTWDTIAADTIAAGGGGDVDGATVREMVGEFVETYGGRDDREQQKKVTAAWKALSYEEQEALMLEVFPDDQTYGY